MTAAIHFRFNLIRSAFVLDVDLNVPARGITAIFGPSGSGKTTLLRCLAGLEEAKEGAIDFNGEKWQAGKLFVPPHKRSIGYVFQEASLFQHLSVRGNLLFGLKRASSADNSALDAAVELLGIGALLDRKPATLSGGESQRVAIARALAMSPKLLLMDEPLASLDAKRKAEILPYLERLHEELAIPVLYVSHAIDEVVRLADHLVVMEHGRAVASGPLGATIARLDLPGSRGEDIGVVLEGTVSERDDHWHLTRIDLGDGSLWTRDLGVPVGQPIRIRVLARDVSLCAQAQENTSILNSLEGVVEGVFDDDHPGLALARVRVGKSIFLARLTKKSVALLGIRPEKKIWLQVKTVTLTK